MQSYNGASDPEGIEYNHVTLLIMVAIVRTSYKTNTSVIVDLNSGTKMSHNLDERNGKVECLREKILLAWKRSYNSVHRLVVRRM